jgi:hypothetical protein
VTDFEHDETVMVTSSTQELISHNRASVKVEPGCTWTYLLHEGERVGVAFSGPSKFTVDAITETSTGAVGRTVSGSLKGIQIYIGKTSLENVSESVSDNVLKDSGYADAAAFLKAVDEAIEHRLNGGRRVKIGKQNDAILLGMSEQEKPLILLVRQSSIVFVKDGNVFVDEDGRTVSVGKSGLALRDKDGRSIILAEDGIAGLNDLRWIGPMVGRAMRMACDPGSFRFSRRRDHMMHGTDCCDEDEEQDDI